MGEARTQCGAIWEPNPNEKPIIASTAKASYRYAATGHMAFKAGLERDRQSRNPDRSHIYSTLLHHQIFALWSL